MPCSTVQVTDGHVEMVDAFVDLGSMIDSSGGSRGEVLHLPGGRQVFVTTDGALCTQQRSSGVCYIRRC